MADTGTGGRWNIPGVPHKGWTCGDVEDLRGDAGPDEYIPGTCEMCGNSGLRFVHHMTHLEHDGLGVGAICAEKMSEDYVGPREREQKLMNKAGMRSRWLGRAWRRSAKGNPYLRLEGYVVGVYTGKYGRWGWRIGSDFGKTWHDTEDAAKLALFEEFWRRTRG